MSFMTTTDQFTTDRENVQFKLFKSYVDVDHDYLEYFDE